jgi:hypothetical protein
METIVTASDTSTASLANVRHITVASRKRAPITPWGCQRVSTGVVLRLPPDHVHN